MSIIIYFLDNLSKSNFFENRFPGCITIICDFRNILFVCSVSVQIKPTRLNSAWIGKDVLLSVFWGRDLISNIINLEIKQFPNIYSFFFLKLRAHKVCFEVKLIMAGNHSGHMVTEFENAFQACLAALTNEDHFNVHDPEEIRAGVEQTIAKFLDMAKQMECFFLQKRLILSAQRPEQIVKEDITDLRAELIRKDQLIQKHYEKIQVWQNLLSSLHGPGHRPQPMPNQNQPQQQAPPPHAQNLPHQYNTVQSSGPSPMNINSVPSQIPMMHMNQSMNQGAPIQAQMQNMPPTQMFGPNPTAMSQQMGGNSGIIPPHMQHPAMHSRLQGPLAYLEKTTSNIGMPEQRQCLNVAPECCELNAYLLSATTTQMVILHLGGGLSKLFRSSQVIAVNANITTRRYFGSAPVIMAVNKGLVLGVYSSKGNNEQETKYTLTPSAKEYDNTISGNLSKLIPTACNSLKKGKSRVLYGLDQTFGSVALTCLGPEGVGYNVAEEIDEKREGIRAAIASAVRQLRDGGVKEIVVDACEDAEAAAEGGSLALFTFDELKQQSSRKPACSLSVYSHVVNPEIETKWKSGIIKAEGQNLARRLTETPANIMTPSRFAQIATEFLTPLGVTVTIRDKQWAESQKMGSFLSVSRGSDEPLVFLETSYTGNPSFGKPVALVGKGVTFDSGGISIKPAANMDKMRGDMGGAACVIGAIYTIASLKLPVNVIGLTPLCENMPSGKANKPGDVVYAMNGKSIQIDNTDAEGRLILADALCHAHTFDPIAIIDMATLTGAMRIALGAAAAGVFSNSTVLWEELHEAGKVSGDRVWRMPLFELYKRQVCESHLADLNNIAGQGLGGSCTAAAFLKEFVTANHWAHLDIAGVSENKDEVPYLCGGLTGRPTRTIVEFLNRLVTKNPF
ncbi:hypothetical protein CHUAL_009328 [Chamberlinius hualienensis]